MRYELAIIGQHDYEAFRNLPTRDLPNTHEEWLQLSAQRKLEWSRAGVEIVEVQVHSDEFARYLAATGQSGNMKTLWDLVREKIGGTFIESTHPSVSLAVMVAAIRMIRTNS